MRGIHWYVGCSFLLLALAGCNSWFAQREPWRREAEEQCLRSGAVKEGPGIALLRPIDGPGICGADFPLKVEALGETNPLGFADDPRPPGLVPQRSTYTPPPAPNYSARPTPGPPLQLAAPNDPYAGRDARAATAPVADSYRY
ncbi:MAG: extensin, partial [Xanthobacteraceae bacterium]